MRLPDPKRSTAILIGTAAYRSTALNDLPAVANNLTDLRTALTHPRWGGFTDCETLLDPTDDRAVYRALREAAKGADDTLVVYFAGHGLTGIRRNELYLCLPDTDPDELRISALSFELIRDVFLDAPATNRILILDCCYSGRAVADFLSDTALLGQTEISGTYTITSASANTAAAAPSGAAHTTFTGELITLLRNGIPNGPQLLTLDTLYRRLRHTLTARGLPVPGRHGTDTADLLALTRNPAVEAPTEPVPIIRIGRAPVRRRHTILAILGALLLITAAVLGVAPLFEPGPQLKLAATLFHSAEVRAVAFNPDGRTLATATASPDGSIRLWDVSTRTVVDQYTGRDGITGIAISRNGRFLAASRFGGTMHVNNDELEHVWGDIAEPGSARTASDVAFSHDDATVAVASSNNGAELWRSFVPERVGGAPTSDSNAHSVAFSPDGTWLAVGTDDGTVLLWDPQTQRTKTISAHRGEVSRLAFSPDGRVLATVSRYDNSARLWDVDTGRAEGAPLDGHTSGVCAVAFRDGRLLATGSRDDTVRLWDLDQHRAVGEPLTGQLGDVCAVAFSPDGRYLATGSDDLTVRLWEVSVP